MTPLRKPSEAAIGGWPSSRAPLGERACGARPSRARGGRSEADVAVIGAAIAVVFTGAVALALGARVVLAAAIQAALVANGGRLFPDLDQSSSIAPTATVARRSRCCGARRPGPGRPIRRRARRRPGGPRGRLCWLPHPRGALRQRWSDTVACRRGRCDRLRTRTPEAPFGSDVAIRWRVDVAGAIAFESVELVQVEELRPRTEPSRRSRSHPFGLLRQTSSRCDPA